MESVCVTDREPSLFCMQKIPVQILAELSMATRHLARSPKARTVSDAAALPMLRPYELHCALKLS